MALFFLSNTLGFPYTPVDKNSPDLSQLCKMEYNIAPILNELSRSCSISVHAEKQFNPEKIMGFLKNGKPVFISLDAAKLRYHPVFTRVAGRQHCIVLYGMDLEGKQCYIMDTHIRDESGKVENFSGNISFDELEGQVDYCAIFDTGQARVISFEELLNSVSLNVERFLTSETGLGGLKSFADDFNLLYLLEDSALEEKCLDINHKLGISVVIELFDLLSRMINENLCLQKGSYEQVLDGIRCVQVQWNNIRLRILKIGLSKRRNQLDGVYHAFHKMIASQEEVLELYLTIIRRLVLNR
ncbi:hypothetical protein D3C76_817250 [compost metagenome]